ncbi:hypothetical protein, partial [uncultured Dysosmobacter sp.]|uniref:hypothetical protein n=1 Tax=uncultured Dysosmobacter sp. TaxID=2591384 RepID=UPI002611F576
ISTSNDKNTADLVYIYVQEKGGRGSISDPVDGVSVVDPYVDRNGAIRFELDVERPEYVPETYGAGKTKSKATITYDIYVNGRLDDANKTYSASTGEGSYRVGPLNDALDPEKDEIEIKITKVVWDRITVLYEDEDGNTVKTVAGKTTTDIANDTTGKNIGFTLDANDYKAAGTYTVTGVTNDPALTGSVTVGGGGTNIRNAVPAGDDYVRVVITGLEAAAENYDVILDNNLTKSAQALSALDLDFAVPTAAGSLQLAIGNSRNDNITGLKPGDAVIMTATGSENLAATSPVGYKVTVSVDGVEKTITWANDNSTISTAPTWRVTITDHDVHVKVVKIEAVAAPQIKSIVYHDNNADGAISETATADTFVVTFTEALSAVPTITKTGTLEVDGQFLINGTDQEDKSVVVYTVSAGTVAAEKPTIAAKQIKSAYAVNIDEFTLTIPAAPQDLASISWAKTGA